MAMRGASLVVCRYYAVRSQLSSATFLAAQNPEYDFYPEFRNSFTLSYAPRTPALPMTQEQIAERYAAKLREEGVRETEITHRVTVLLTKRNALEAEYWNRYYLDSKSNFNRAPNDFLR